MINLNDYLRKPFDQLQRLLLRCGYHISGREVDRKLKMTGVTFVRTKKKHDKVCVWHCWEEPDASGVCKAGVVTDIDYKNLEVKDDTDVRKC